MIRDKDGTWKGETRTRKRFLFFPLTISGVSRWWELVSWEEIWTKVVVESDIVRNLHDSGYREVWFWKRNRWLN